MYQRRKTIGKKIHYCWFGGKPLPKLAKKCIKSWKKYLPDYEIIEINEKNFDINICPFVKQAYEKKMWAFVSDYARLYELYENGGIYFDTDMEVTKNIDFLTEKKFFIGYEANKVVAAGVIGVKESHNKYIKELLEFYNEKSEFSEELIFDYAIPKVMTNAFKKYPMETVDDIDIINKDIYIYPEEYFYPINYDYSKRNCTANTCMIHYYNATWVPKGEKLAVTVYRIFGKTLGKAILSVYYRLCNFKNRIIGSVKRKFWNLYHFLSIHFNQDRRVRRVTKKLEDLQGEYIVISHPEWIGVGNVAKDNFKYNIELREQYTEKEAKKMAAAILANKYKLVIFNGLANGWGWIIKEIKRINPNVIIKILWHGSNALLCEEYDWNSYKTIFDLYQDKKIDEIGFVKKSMYEFFKAKGVNASFVMNSIEIKNKEKYMTNAKKSTKTKIGLYTSGDRWVKNTYSQVAAASLIENAELNCIPLSHKIVELARIYKLNINGQANNLPREKLLKKMAANDINLYVTFTECAPLIPLESLELGTVCITGDNHHYFAGTELGKYLVIDKEDNIIEIYNKIKFALENKQKILELYKEWKIEYSKKAKESIEMFLKI